MTWRGDRNNKGEELEEAVISFLLTLTPTLTLSKQHLYLVFYS